MSRSESPSTHLRAPSPPVYVFSGSGCRAATTPPRAAAEPLARSAPFPGRLYAAERGAIRRSATSSTTLNGYSGGEGGMIVEFLARGSAWLRCEHRAPTVQDESVE